MAETKNHPASPHPCCGYYTLSCTSLVQQVNASRKMRKRWKKSPHSRTRNPAAPHSSPNFRASDNKLARKQQLATRKIRGASDWAIDSNHPDVAAWGRPRSGANPWYGTRSHRRSRLLELGTEDPPDPIRSEEWSLYNAFTPGHHSKNQDLDLFEEKKSVRRTNYTAPSPSPTHRRPQWLPAMRAERLETGQWRRTRGVRGQSLRWKHPTEPTCVGQSSARIEGYNQLLGNQTRSSTWTPPWLAIPREYRFWKDLPWRRLSIIYLWRIKSH